MKKPIDKKLSAIRGRLLDRARKLEDKLIMMKANKHIDRVEKCCADTEVHNLLVVNRLPSRATFS